jgi:ABC-type Fe3+-hydroxamate transport system substrate-binding protein
MKKFTSMVKPKGNASCVFGELGAKENSLDPDLLDLKKKIAPSDHQILKDAYQRAVTSFEKERDIILEKGSQVIPQVNFADIVDAQLPHNLVSEIRKRGCVVIRNVYQQEEANKYNNDTNAYIKKNRNKVTGYPEDRPQIWEIYWSRSQVNARSHPNFTAAALAVQKLWHAADDTVIDLGKNLTYCDRLLVKNPGDSSFVLHEHLDNGSLERWQDPEYRKCYTNVLSGNWEVELIYSNIFFTLKSFFVYPPLFQK